MILTIRNKSLRQVCAVVDYNDPELPGLIDRLRNELLAINGKGIGLSANQIGVLKQVSVIHFPENWYEKYNTGDLKKEYVLINPKILKYGANVKVNEGCLSVPDVFADIERSETCEILNHRLDGTEEIIEAKGILAQVFQHEIDHLSGKVFIDYFTRAQQIIYENRIRRIK